MDSLGLLADFAVALVAALVAGVACIRLRQPVLVGYLLAGIAIGPHGLGWVRDEASIRELGEIGVLLLMFALGVEFSLAQFRPLRRLVLAGGTGFILVCMAVTAAAFILAGAPASQATLFAFMAALSSTIVVMRVLMDKHAMDSVHGMTMLGWLILQDLAVIPMLVALPFLAAPAGIPAGVVAPALGKAVAFLALVYVLGTVVYPWVFGRLAATRHKELFFLGVIAVGTGTAALSAACGLSISLGAFLAGLAIGQSDEHHQVLAEVLPVRDLFVTLFFVSIGMLLDPGFVLRHVPVLLGLVAAIVVGKAALGTLVALALKLSPRTALLIGLGLAQIGEFSFVLAKEGHGLGLISESQFMLTLGAALITMLLTPAVMRAASPIAAWTARFYRGGRVEPGAIAPDGELNGHVIIVGFGRVGQQLGGILHQRNVPFLVVDLDRALLRRLKARGYRTLFGDGAMREVLDHAGLATARMLVVALPDPSASRLVVAQACEARPGLEVVASAQRRADARALVALGATDVVQTDLEAGMALMRTALVRLGWPPMLIHGFLAHLRHQPDAEPLDGLDEPHQLTLRELLAPPPGCEAAWLNIKAGCSLAGMGLGANGLKGCTGLTVLALRRGQRHILHPGDQHQLQEGDALLVLGTPDQLQAALALMQAPVKVEIVTQSPAANR